MGGLIPIFKLGDELQLSKTSNKKCLLRVQENSKSSYTSDKKVKYKLLFRIKANTSVSQTQH
jgi:hypothetical protein